MKSHHDPIAGLKKKYPWLGADVVPVYWAGEHVPVSVPAVWPARGCEGMVDHATVRDLFNRGLALGKEVARALRAQGARRPWLIS